MLQIFFDPLPRMGRKSKCQTGWPKMIATAIVLTRVNEIRFIRQIKV